MIIAGTVSLAVLMRRDCCGVHPARRARRAAARRRRWRAEHNLLLSIIDTIPEHVYVKD